MGRIQRVGVCSLTGTAAALAVLAATTQPSAGVSPTSRSATEVPSPGGSLAVRAPGVHAASRAESRIPIVESSPSVTASAPPTPPDPRSVARSLAAARGWTGWQWTCLDDLWRRESAYQTTATNPTTGAYGIPQALPASKMASAGADWRFNPATQITWGLDYIENRYGDPCTAWEFWLRHGFY
ncbi:MAG: lytic transglycosylase domain-containing protein [Acidothermus sp.]|nr:lytic transglycosylase domain-containing protein [Acidothermus sp.]